MCPRTGEPSVSSYSRHCVKRLGACAHALDSRQNIFFNVSSPTAGTFLIALHFKGRDKPIIEMDLKIDDLLELESAAQQAAQQGLGAGLAGEDAGLLNLEYVKLDAHKVHGLFNKVSLGSGAGAGERGRGQGKDKEWGLMGPQLFSKRR